MFYIEEDNKTYLCNEQEQVKAGDLAVIIDDNNLAKLKRADSDYYYFIDGKPIRGRAVSYIQYL